MYWYFVGSESFDKEHKVRTFMYTGQKNFWVECVGRKKSEWVNCYSFNRKFATQVYLLNTWFQALGIILSGSGKFRRRGLAELVSQWKLVVEF